MLVFSSRLKTNVQAKFKTSRFKNKKDIEKNVNPYFSPPFRNFLHGGNTLPQKWDREYLRNRGDP